MKGLKICILGLSIILISGFILIDDMSNLGGFGEVFLFFLGIIIIILGINKKE
ncbi:hypothetical protein OF820_10795 [Oceanotoga sp. DSM 15011]|jgi:hypothetical protein|uniref:Uncharacterized protein n=1 Tax=Oceanotoga teriensis TaxID=515440 RepID=A0AA45C845_9BACT|nr:MULTISPECIES: hypothetical protein [Oceanotoga]MDN5341293.1 hypothetical protein [Oceanotoga sp.]MDO7976980.1 hypothetical protein [Oceanotoga teriensis]PWJ95718.1 hypothetical protein C7380_104137 [Oceanotoga teriensis]UYO99552.1 hypothetical protein OF820_10795 [Oceanotoga sp. DSM 15011]